MPPRKPVIDAAELKNTAEAAKYLKCSTGHIRKLVERKKLAPAGKGGPYVFTKSELERYESERRQAGRPVGSGEIVRSEERRERHRQFMRSWRKKRAIEKKKAGRKKEQSKK